MLNFYGHPGRDFQFREGVYHLLRRVVDVNQALVSTDFKLLSCIFVNDRGSENCEKAFMDGEGDRTGNTGSGTTSGIYNLSR